MCRSLILGCENKPVNDPAVKVAAHHRAFWQADVCVLCYIYPPFPPTWRLLPCHVTYGLCSVDHGSRGKEGVPAVPRGLESVPSAGRLPSVTGDSRCGSGEDGALMCACALCDVTNASYA